jgi:1-acyl-sn-glycerol-3-phosphate acyltransferase
MRGYLALLKHVCKLGYEIRGIENIPDHPVLFASKQLSKWDSAVLPVLLGDPAVVLRRNLLFFPLYGPIIFRMRHLAIPRRPSVAAAANLVRAAKCRIVEGRSVFIFPEGTRTAVHRFPLPHYKHGVVALYRALDVPCVPIAVNSGLYWPKRSLLRYPGTIIAEILPPIPCGLSSSSFLAELISQLEINSERLVREGLATAPPEEKRRGSSNVKTNRNGST